MVHIIPNSYVPNISHTMAQNEGGKTSFAVDSSSLIYSHFTYVSGVAAPDGTNGVAINKLYLVDVLIGQLNQMKKDVQVPVMGAASDLDTMIETYRDQIHQAMAASELMPYLPSPGVMSGALFSISV